MSFERGLRRFVGEWERDEGQSVIFVGISLFVLLGFLGLTLDVGRLYLAQRQLQTGTDAAALAAAQDLPNGTTAIQTAGCYSSSSSSQTCPSIGPVSNGYNWNASLGTVSTTAALECLSQTSAGASCLIGTGCPSTQEFPPYGTTNNVGGCNAIKVTASTSVKPILMQILGIGSQTVTATSTASLAGGNAKPLDIEVATDRTISMSESCDATVAGISSPSKLDCAKLGIRELLEELNPCSLSLTTCGSDVAGTHDVADPLDRVGLMAFPPEKSPSMTENYTLPGETDCYTDVSGSNISLSQTSGDYQLVPLSSDYKKSDTTGTSDSLLNKYSDLVGAVYWGRCPGGVYPTGSGAGSSIDEEGTTTATNSGGIGGGTGSAANIGSASNGIGGGPNSGDPGDTWTGKTTTAASSLKLSLPANAAVGDFYLATITGEAAGLTASSLVCPPSGWTPVKQTVSKGGSGTPIIEATFSGSLLATGGIGPGPTYTFNFDSSGTCGSTNPPPTPITLAATASLVRYTNVAGVDGAGAVADQLGNPTTTPFAGTAAAGTAWPNSTAYPGVTTASHAWSTTTTYIAPTSVTGCSNGFSTSITACDATAAADETISGIDFSFGTATAKKTTYKVTLLVNGAAASPALSCTVAAQQTGCSQIATEPVSVVAGDKLVLSLVRTAGTNLTATADGSLTTGQYVALATSCVSISATTCDGAAATAAGTLASFGVTFGSNIPSGDTFDVALLQNGESTGSSCDISRTTTTCPASLSLAVAANATLELLVTQTAGTTPLTASAATSASETVGGTLLTAPVVQTGSAGDMLVHLYATASSFSSGTVPALQATGATATGVDDELWASAGQTIARSVSSATAENWAAQTVALTLSAPSSVSIPAPSAAVVGDFLLATLSVNGLGSGVICAPTGWTQVGTTSTSGTGSSSISEATYSKTYAASDPTPYAFDFASACTNGTPIPADATGMIVRYTGVSGATGLDGTPPVPRVGTDGSTAASPITAPSQTTTVKGDEIVRLFATGASSFASGASPEADESGALTSSGITDSSQTSPGATGTATVESGAPANWSARTVSLEQSAGITISRPGTPSSGDLIVVSVTARSTGTGGSGYICAPDSDWTYIPQSSTTPTAEPTAGTGINQITHASFWSVRGTSVGETYTFNFQNATCGSNGATAVSDLATAVAVDYTGADAINAIDFDNESTASTTYDTGESTTATGNITGSGGTLTAPTIETNYFNDEIVHSFGTGASTLTLGSKGIQAETSPSSSTGLSDEGAAGAAASGKGSSRTATGGTGEWIGETFAIIADQPGCVAGQGTGSCSYGLEAPSDFQNMSGGNGIGTLETYYGNAIAQAQASLDAYGQSGSQKVIVLLSDGDANLDGPDACKQAIYNAEKAEAEGIWVVTIAYESDTSASNSCYTDNPNQSFTVNHTTYRGTLAISALCTMQLIADNPVTKPTDSHFAGLSTQPTNYTVTSTYSAMENYCSNNATSDTNVTGSRFYRVSSDAGLANVFQAIGESLSTERLVSNSAT